MTSPPLVALTVTAAFALYAVTGCAEQSQPTSDSSERPRAAGVDLAAAEQALQGGMDEEPVDQPTDYYANSQLVVRGALVDFILGRVLFGERATAPGTMSMVTMQVKVEQFIKGDASGDDMVYVELPANGYDLDLFRQSLPPGTEVALYLYSAQKEGGEFVTGNDGGGAPEGTPLWVPMGSEAIVVALGDKGVAMPMAGKVVPRARLADELP